MAFYQQGKKEFSTITVLKMPSNLENKNRKSQNNLTHPKYINYRQIKESKHAKPQ